MDSLNAYQMLCNFDIQLRSHSYENANRILTLIGNNLKASFCIPISKDYNKSYAHNTAFFFVTEHYDHPEPLIQKTIRHFIHRWSFIISSISPLDFLGNIKGLIKKERKFNDFVYVFLPSLGNAISLLSDDDILHNFSLIQKFFHNVYPSKQSEIPKSIWQVIGKFSPENEIMQILQKNMDIQFTSIAPILIQKNPMKYTNYLFKEASSDFLNEFLKNCPQSYRIDINEIITRVSKDCSQLGTAGFNSTCQLFGNAIQFYTYDLTEEQKNQITTILNKIYTFLTDEKIVPSDINCILSTLYEGARKNLFERDQLKKFLPKIQFTEDCPQLQITFLKISILCMDKDSDNMNASKTILSIHPWFGQIYIQYLEVIEENFFYIKEISPSLSIRILWSIFHPLPLDPQIAVNVVKFLLKMSPSDVTEPHVDANLQQLFDSYFNIQNSELTKLTLSLARLYKYSPPVTKIDIFGKFSENSIPLLTNVDPMLIKELISSHIIEPSKRHSLLHVMQSWPRCYPDIASSIISLLYMASKYLGLLRDIDNSLAKCGLQKVEMSEDIFSMDELKKLYAEIDGPIDQSDFGILIQTALDAFAVISTDSQNRTKIHQNHVAKGALISSYFISICPKHVLSLLSRLQAFRSRNYKADEKDKSKAETSSACAGYTEAFRIAESVQIPIKYSIDVVSYANVRYGSFSNVMKKFPKYVNDALSRSRIVADMFKKELTQPIQPLKTFLSFVGLKEHEEWVEVCSNVIPPQDWKIKLSDANAIEGLKNLSEETKRIVKKKLETIRNLPKPVSKLTESYEGRSDFMRLKNPIQILAGPKIHLKDTRAVKPGSIAIEQIPLKTPSPAPATKQENQEETEEQEQEKEKEKEGSNEAQDSTTTTTTNNEPTTESSTGGDEGTLFEVISFLWHSKSDLPESIKPEDLENLALANAKNAKLLIGFFSWANNHNYTIDLQKWQNAINVKHHTELWLFAIAMLASNVHCPFMEIPKGIIRVFQKCLTSFGYPAISKTSLSYGYYHLTGVKWLIVRNIISIDPNFFSEYPLIVAELTKNMDVFKKYFDQLDTEDYAKVNFDSFIGINDILFNPPEDEMMQTTIMPTNRNYHTRIYSFKEISHIPIQREIPKELLESIINALQKAKYVSYSYFAFFMNIKMTNEQFSRVYDIFFKDRESSSMKRYFMLPSLFVSETGKSAYLQDEAIRFFSRKPPSLTRAFFRSLLCRFAPPINQDLIAKIESKLEVVFPGLCYNGFGKSGIKMWENALPLSKLRFGYIDNTIGSSLLTEMEVPCNEAMSIYKLLLNLNDDELAVAQPFATKGMIRDELSRIFLKTATSQNSNACFALNVAAEVCKSISIDNAMILIANRDLIERPNFLCAIVILEFLNHVALKDKNQTVLEFIKMLKNPENNLIENEERKNIFVNLDKDDFISQLIHPSAKSFS